MGLLCLPPRDRLFKNSMKIFTDNPDFYPTPNAVIEQMMMGEDYIGKIILEPSAGKGNIVDWMKENNAGEVIACENDPISEGC